MMTVDFLFDFGSPNAYLAHVLIPSIEERTGARFNYVPILLGGVFKATGNVSPIVANANIHNKREFARREFNRFIRKYEITTFRPNPHFPVNTLNLMRGAVAAQQAGVFVSYVEAMFRFMWSEPKKMDDPAEWRAALTAANLDAEELMTLAQDPQIKQMLVTNTEAAVARGVFGAPTFFVGDEMFFGKDQLRDVEDELRASDGSSAVDRFAS